jgi:hypothetical protein
LFRWQGLGDPRSARYLAGDGLDPPSRSPEVPPMFRPFAFAVAVIALAGHAPADDKKDKKADPPAFSGVWVREVNGLDLKIEFAGKDGVKIAAFHDENGVIAVCKYKAEKGVLKATITDVIVKGDFKNKPAKGLEFSFQWTVKGDTATLDDLTGKELESAKTVLEGEYERKKAKK